MPSCSWRSRHAQKCAKDSLWTPCPLSRAFWHVPPLTPSLHILASSAWQCTPFRIGMPAHHAYLPAQQEPNGDLPRVLLLRIRHQSRACGDPQNRRGGRVKLQSILLPETEFNDPEKGDALYAMEVSHPILATPISYQADVHLEGQAASGRP